MSHIMNRLTRQHMAASRRRTLMTILGVIVSVAMITAVSIGAASFKNMFQQMAMEDSGYWHAMLSGITTEQAARLEKDGNVENLFLSRELMYGRLADGMIRNEEKPYLYIAEYDEKAFEGMSLKLVEGRFAENGQELVIPKHLLTNGKAELAVGDTLTVTLGRRYVEYAGADAEKQYLGQNDPYLVGAETDESGEESPVEQFEEAETRTYTVVGIVERPGTEGYYAPGYSAFTYLDASALSPEETVNARLFLHKVNTKLYDQVQELAADAGISPEELSYNSSVLMYYGVSGYRDFVLTMRAMELILIAIIMVGSISLIYNSFAISITERSKQFGMLSSVGATRKQKRNAVLYEGGVIGGIAVPLGLLFGCLGMAVTFRIVRTMLTSSRGGEVPLRICVSLPTLLTATGFSVLTIFLSAYLPARRASRISAIEAIRQTQDIRLTRKAVRTPRIVRWLFGLPGEIALKNLKRNRKRYRAMVFSLLVSLVLFTTVGSYVFYVTDIYGMSADSNLPDISVYFDSQADDPELFSRLCAVNGIRQGGAYDIVTMSLEISSEVTEPLLTKDAVEMRCRQYRRWGWEEEAIREERRQMESGNSGMNSGVGIELILMEDDAYAAYAKQVGAEEAPEGMFGGILVNWGRTKTNGALLEAPMLSVSAGETLKLAYVEREYDYETDENGTGDRNERIVFSQEIPVYLTAETKELPFGKTYFSVTGDVGLYLPKSQWEELAGQLPEGLRESGITNYYFSVEEDEDEAVEEELKAVLDGRATEEYSLYNRIAAARQDRQMLLAISIFAYGFIALISLICVANLCNTISTSFALRRREFAMLKSIGMEARAFRRMIRFESLLYGIKALLYGVPLSLLLTYGLYRSFTHGDIYTPFAMPWRIYGIGVAAVLLVVFAAMSYSSRKIKDESIVEGLKSEIE